MKLIHATLATAFTLAVASTAFAAGNGAPSGSHYTLNIIGVSKGKTSAMTGSDRHTIFVALGSKTTSVQSKIDLYQGEDFQVCNGNGFDAATDCAGNQIAATGAVFQLPCNPNISDDQDALAECDGGPEDSYAVYARALGQPGGSAVITTCATVTSRLKRTINRSPRSPCRSRAASIPDAAVTYGTRASSSREDAASSCSICSWRRPRVP
jgi:hypothetical protein